MLNGLFKRNLSLLSLFQFGCCRESAVQIAFSFEPFQSWEKTLRVAAKYETQRASGWYLYTIELVTLFELDIGDKEACWLFRPLFHGFLFCVRHLERLGRKELIQLQSEKIWTVYERELCLTKNQSWLTSCKFWKTGSFTAVYHVG